MVRQRAARIRETVGQMAAKALPVLLLAALACRRAASQSDPVPPSSAPPAPPPAIARAEAAGYSWTPGEKAAVEEFLRRNPGLRVATDKDRTASLNGDGDVRGLYGIYHPYFVRGDLNDDGILDFVLAFVRRDARGASPWFSIVIFTGLDRSQGGPEFEPGKLVERDVSLARGDVSIDRDAVLITPDTADEAVRRYRWDPAKRAYVFVRDAYDDVEAPEVSRT